MNFPERNIAIACNPKRKKASKVADSIAVLLSGMDVRHSIFTDNWLSDWNAFTEVWIVGGDGTLNYFINQNSDIEIPLAIFAGGTGNDFHWMLYGNISVEEQVEKVLLGKPMAADAGRCNGRLFLNGIGIGFDGKIVFDLLDKEKSGGKLSYKVSVLKNILFYRSFNCRMKYERHTIEQKCLMISIANGRRYGGGFYVAPEAFVDDGLFDVNIVGRMSSLQRVRWFPVIEKGKHLELSFIKHFQTKQFSIEAEQVIHAHADGEYFTDRKFVIECLAKRFVFVC